MTLILGPDGKPANIPEVALPKAPAFRVTRQLRRAYLRTCAISEINQLYGPEPRKIRRSMALSLAKRPAFIDKIRQATHAF